MKKISPGVILIILSSLFITTASLRIADPDVFWHLAAGEWIIEHHAVPKIDVYSWSAHGIQWLDYYWLWQVLLNLLYVFLGVPGLWLLPFLAGSGAGLFVYYGLKHQNVSEEIAAVCGAIIPLLLVKRFVPWPHIGNYCFFGAYIYMSLRKTWTWKEVVLSFIIGVTWSNIHAMATVLPQLLLAETIWYGVVIKERIGWRLAAALSAGIATLINPNGFLLWKRMITEGPAGSLLVRQNIAEWLPFWCKVDVLNLFIFFSSLGILYVAVRQKGWKNLAFIRASVFWIIAMYSRVVIALATINTVVLLGSLSPDWRSRLDRYCPAIFIFSSLFLLIVYIMNLISDIFNPIPLVLGAVILMGTLILGLKNESLNRLSLIAFTTGFVLTCILWVVILYFYTAWWMPYLIPVTVLLALIMLLGIKNNGMKRLATFMALLCVLNVFLNGIPQNLDEIAEENGYPLAAVEHCRDSKVLNDFNWGGFLIWKGIPVYIDGRIDPYINKIYKEYMEVISAKSPDVVEKTGADAVLTRPYSRMRAVMQKAPGWELVHEDGLSVLFKKKSNKR